MAEPINAAQLVISPAESSEASDLWHLALESKAHWGYSAEFMAGCREELRVPNEWISDGKVFVGKLRSRPVGFFSLVGLDDDEAELWHFFVAPGCIGSGIGRRLFAEAVSLAHSKGLRRLKIQSDPCAEGFYARMGARKAGEMESLSVEGRFLPVFVYELDEAVST